MEIFSLALLLLFGLHLLKSRERAARVALLGSFLAHYEIEKLMESLTDGYLRALGEQDAQRRAQIWDLLATTEKNLALQLQSFADDFGRVPADEARVSTLAIALPYASRWFPAATFDMREMLQLHARGIAAVVAQAPAGEEGMAQERKRQAYTVTAELYLLQHSCHWFCKSKTVASARMLARHQTPHAQLLASVSPETRRSYLALTGPV